MSRQECQPAHAKLAPVQRYRDWLATLGKDHVVIKVPEHGGAYAMGYRFTTCERDELAEYIAGGATEVQP